MSQPAVLIIDDNRDLADGLGLILEDEGYKVTLAYNGDDGIKTFKTGCFDVVLVDFKLPNKNGVAVLHELYKTDPEVRVLMMSGYRIEQLLASVIGNGGVEIVRKPFKLERVLEILERSKTEDIILLADDDPDSAKRLSAYLTDHGMETLLARSSQDAVDGVSSSPVEVLVLDSGMPVIFCLEAYLAIKQRGHAVKTMIVTGYPGEEPETVDVLRSTSVTGCLFKPFKPEDMLRAVKRIMDCQGAA